MFRSTFNLALAAASIAVPALAVDGSGHSTRYWDCCKPSCSWPGKSKSVTTPVGTCAANNTPLADQLAVSGCQGGPSFTCANFSPYAVSDELSYGFAATAINGGTEDSWCCACYKLTFTSGTALGKTMVVQSTNTGSDISNNQFDILIPGGGVGIYDGCKIQYGTSLPGAVYGGVSKREECDQMPAALVAGCQWRFDWFLNADNPTFEFQQVQCPAELTAISGCKRSDDASFPVA